MRDGVKSLRDVPLLATLRQHRFDLAHVVLSELGLTILAAVVRSEAASLHLVVIVVGYGARLQMIDVTTPRVIALVP